MLNVMLQHHRTSGSEDKDLNYILAWRPSRLCDLDHLYTLSSPFQWRFPLPFGIDCPSASIGKDPCSWSTDEDRSSSPSC